MLFQIGVLRELRFQLSSIFTLTPFLFSSVGVLIGLGSLAAKRLELSTQTLLRRTVAALPVAVLPLFAMTILVAQATISHSSSAFDYSQATGSQEQYMNSVVFAFLAVAVVGYGVVFFLQGLVFAVYFREGRRTGLLSEVYALDLGASGIAALAGGYFCLTMTPIQMTLVATGLFLVTLWVAKDYLNTERRTLAVVTALALLMIGGELSTGFLQRLEAPRWLGSGLIHSEWSPYRRIDVVDKPGRFGVFTDGLLFHEYRPDDTTHEWDPRAVPVRALFGPDSQAESVLVIGAGTGSDVRILRDLASPDLEITAVELDQGFIDTASRFPFLWDSYSTAEIVVQEGRFYLENSHRTFDVVQYAYVDPQSAISKVGLPDANFLYMSSGLSAAYDRVADGGQLVITRVFLVEKQEEFIRRLCATLESAGVSPEDVQLYRYRDTVHWGYYGNLSSVHAVVGKGASPVPLDDDRLVSLEWIPGGQPTTDRYPFSLLTDDWFGVLGGYLAGNWLLLALLSLYGAGLLWRLGTSVGHASFFALGLSSFLVECLVLFNSFLLIGNPSLSAAVGVGFFLFWNGVGSLLSERFEKSRLFGVAVPGVIVLYGLTAPVLNSMTIASPL